MELAEYVSVFQPFCSSSGIFEYSILFRLKIILCVPRFLSSSPSQLWKVVCGDSQGSRPSRFVPFVMVGLGLGIFRKVTLQDVQVYELHRLNCSLQLYRRLSKPKSNNQGTLGCTPNVRVPMVFIVFYLLCFLGIFGDYNP